MTKYTIEEMKEYVRKLNEYRDSYYNFNESKISDKLFDEMCTNLSKMEDELGVVLSNSPNNSIGFEVKSELVRVKHSHPMKSLDKVKDDVNSFYKYFKDREWVLMHKLDGLTCLLTYENGELVKAETRGDGEMGEDITHNAKTFKNIPLTIDFKGKLEIEGEAIILYDDFEKINAGRPEDKKFQNPRNLASGSVRQLDSSICANRNVRFYVWKVPFGCEASTIVERFAFAHSLGFEIVECALMNKSKEWDKNSMSVLRNIAEDKGIPIDGLVGSFNDIEYGLSLGDTAHHPRHSLAFKFYEEVAETTLLDIEWTLGKTGAITPTAVFEDVELCGTTVNRASLHNLDIMRELQLGIGDRIEVVKANDIIPQVKSNLTKSNTYKPSSVCPVCGHGVMIYNGQITCVNPECEGTLGARIEHFVGKSGMDIDGFGKKVVDLFVRKGWLHNFMDVYNLGKYKSKMAQLPKFGTKKVNNLLKAIENSRNTTLDKFICALSIPNIGASTSKQIAKHCKNDPKVFIEKAINRYRWDNLNGFGLEMMNGINDYFADKVTVHMVDELISIMNFGNDNVTAASDKLKGMTFVITGTVNIYKNRNELKATIESNGGKVSGSVTSKTNYLVNNDTESNSSKNVKAKQLGVSIISEEEFVKMLES